MTFSGFSSDLQAKAQRIWSMQTGSPYDPGYYRGLAFEFSKAVDLGRYKVGVTQNLAAGYVVDQTVTFSPQ